MSTIDFDLHAQPRAQTGSAAMRRLRRAGRVPGVVYGAGGGTVAIELAHSELARHLEHESFHSHILTLHLDGGREQVVLRGLQRHPVRSEVLHVDLLRVRRDEKIRMLVPLHFLGEDEAPGVRQQSGLVSHLKTEAEVSCLPSQLPEFLAVDVSGLHIGEPVHLSALELPAGVELVELAHGQDPAVVIINVRRERLEPEEEAAAAEEAAAETEEQPDGAADSGAQET